MNKKKSEPILTSEKSFSKGAAGIGKDDKIDKRDNKNKSKLSQLSKESGVDPSKMSQMSPNSEDFYQQAKKAGNVPSYMLDAELEDTENGLQGSAFR